MYKNILLIVFFLFVLIYPNGAHASSEKTTTLNSTYPPVYNEKIPNPLAKSSLSVTNLIYLEKDEITTLDNNPYLPARTFGKLLGGNMKWYDSKKIFVLQANNIYSAFSPQENIAIIKKGDNFINTPVKLILKNGTLYLPLITLKHYNIKYSLTSDTYTVYSNTWEHVYEEELDKFADKASSHWQQTKSKELSKYTTLFNASYLNRTSNIKLASKALNEIIIKPNKIFSFNKTVGVRSPKQGYKKAIIFINKKKIEDYGGGICQVSSTLYNSVLEANLKVLQRKSHSLDVSYVPKGKDATVAYGYIYFVFKNTKPYPIKIKTEVLKNRLTISILKHI